MPARRRTLRLLPALALLLSLSVTVAACGSSRDVTDLVEGEPVELGELQYNVLFSRFLNPDDREDQAYLVGQPAPTPDELYLGIFMQVLNKGDEPASLPGKLTVTDTAGTPYEPIPSDSLYALQLGGTIDAEDQVPALDSTAQTGPIEGSMVLFRVSDETTENRPLTLVIPGQGGPAEVELDI
jgi:hypothetical protein